MDNQSTEANFQHRVLEWTVACFGTDIAADKNERNHRFLEEALELVQAAGCTKGEARQLLDYVFERPVGEIHNEVGGVMVTLAALCSAHGIDMQQDGAVELARVWTKINAIREKQRNKPKHSPLPVKSAAKSSTRAGVWFAVVFAVAIQAVVVEVAFTAGAASEHYLTNSAIQTAEDAIGVANRWEGIAATWEGNYKAVKSICGFQGK